MAMRNPTPIPRHEVFAEGGFVFELTREEHQLCFIEELKINGKEYFSVDFGLVEDLEPPAPEEGGCGNRQFVPYPATRERLKLLNMDEDTFNRINKIFKKRLAIGRCKRCK